MPRYERHFKVGECASCGEERELPCRDWCPSCYRAWHRAGKPESGPPPRRWTHDRAGRMEDLLVLLRGGETDTAALAERIGVSPSTVRSYLADMRLAGVAVAIQAQHQRPDNLRRQW